MRRHRIAALLVSVVVVALAVASAQSSLGHIRGVVKDSQGAVLPGVQVKAVRDGVPDRTTVTDAKGEFAFLGIASGHYAITAALAGFTPLNTTAEVHVAATTTIALTLQVASLAETVTVAAASPMVDASGDAVQGRRPARPPRRVHPARGGGGGRYAPAGRALR
jgi:hypothetical protein